MFNFDAQQIFVLHPRQAGGGIVSSILSLDLNSAALNFKNLSVEQKTQHMFDHFQREHATPNAHPYNFINFGQDSHLALVNDADFNQRYFHKLHFYELFDENNKKLLVKMPNKLAVGISYTSKCIARIDAIRKLKYPVDYYQKWIYDNQKSLLPEYFGIDCKHTIEFSDLLDLTKFLDHICYCCEVFDLDLDLGTAQQLILAWHKEIFKNTL